MGCSNSIIIFTYTHFYIEQYLYIITFGMSKLKDLISAYKLEDHESAAVPYIVGIFLFIFFVVGWAALSHLLF